MRGKDKKMKKVEIENAEGRVMNYRLPYPIAQILVDRLIQGGWPYMGIRIDGHEIISKPDPCCINVYRDKEGKEVIL